MNQCNIVEATHVQTLDGKLHRIVQKWGIDAHGRLFKPSEGGFGCFTDTGERVSMWEAKSYFREIEEAPFMSVWTVYYDPNDFPGKYVVRRHDIFRGLEGSHPSSEHFVADTLEGIRAQIPFGLACMMRSEADDAKIVETWI